MYLAPAFQAALLHSQPTRSLSLQKTLTGNNIGHGGDQFVVEIYNKWTVDSNLNCNAVAGARQTLSAPIKGRMADNGDGTYSFNYSVVLDGAVTVVVKLDVKGVVNWKWYRDMVFTEPPATVGTISQLYFSSYDGMPPFIPGQTDRISGILTGKIKPPTTETYTINILMDDWSNMSINGYMYVNNIQHTTSWTSQFSIFMDKNAYYSFIFYYNNNYVGWGIWTKWSTPTISQQMIPQDYFVDPYLVSSSPYQITTSWPTGFYGTVASSPTQCATIWGDGIKAGTEACDDGNNIDNDGWQADCTLITPGFAWATGNILVAQTWVKCTTAFYPNSDKSACIPKWGDAMRAGSEVWDDGNTNNGDGCPYNWASIETGYSCFGGSISSPDVWVSCTLGFYQDTSHPTQCITRWGDGRRAGSEAWDDANTNNGDGWSSSWAIESAYSCTGGSPSSKDTWVSWSAGYYQDLSNPTTCITRWGDALRAGSEVWDDGNAVSGDGWLNTWTSIEDGFVWSGGSLTSKDIWTKWSSGYYQNSSKDQCISKWGDGLRVSPEYWDDGNTVSGDGWRSNCQLVETDYIWRGGSSNSKDTWTKWNKGYHQDTTPIPTKWVTVCGDGIRAGYEIWDDENTVSGDGWAANWMKVEDGFVWVGGWFGVTDIWLKWDPGYGSNVDYTKCIGAEVPRDVKGLAVASAIATSAGVSSTMLVTMFSSSSSSSSNSFGMINQIQLVILLPLIGAFLPQKIYDYLKSMNASLFNLSFLPSSNSESSINIKSWFDFKQPNSYLYLLQLSSGSALVNILSLTTMVGAVIWLHILLLIIFSILFKLNKLVRVRRLIEKILKMLTFGFYVGVWIETYILFLLVDFSEVHYQSKNGIQNMNSCVASYIIMFCMLMLVLLALWQWIKSRKPENFEKQKYFVAIVDGMKPKWICRSYSFVFLIRRTVFGAILFFFDFVEAIHRVIILTSIQWVYMMYIMILRPHDSIKENLIDVINEVLYLYYLGFLLYFNTENSWDDTTTETYFWILMANNFIIIFITAGR